MKVNFYNKEMFKWKFGRDPKEWTIEQVHDLWRRAYKRNTERRSNLNKFIDDIPNKIQPNAKNEYLLFYNIGDRINVVVLTFGLTFGSRNSFINSKSSWSYHIDSFNVNDNKVENRDRKLAFLISEGIDIGNEFIRLEKDRGFTSLARVESILSDMIDDHFRKYFKELKTYPSDSFITTIGGIDYIINVTNKYDYPKFKISSEVEKSIKI